MGWFRNLFAGDDGKSDEMAVLAVLGVLVFLGLSVFAAVWRGAPWDPQAFGIGFGAVIGAATAGMGFRSRMERGGEPEERK